MSLLRGDGIARDPSESAVWFERAALQGLINAQFSLAVQYLKGEGVERDPVRGFAWLEIAAARGFDPALRARNSIRGKLSAQDLSAANELVKELTTELPQ
ncbi:MAG: sel1 repeat family protein [Myxococcales bacterium]|nr:sel1 repeat family protein [Myxococcales bacterium]